MIRPSFSFPFVKPPNIIPCVTDDILAEFQPFTFKCRPEAPWIKRCGGNIRFTESLQNDSKVQIVYEGTFCLALDEKFLYVPKKYYDKYKDKKYRVKAKADSDTELMQKTDL